jgi:hypothetical protein
MHSIYLQRERCLLDKFKYYMDSTQGVVIDLSFLIRIMILKLSKAS